MAFALANNVDTKRLDSGNSVAADSPSSSCQTSSPTFAYTSGNHIYDTSGQVMVPNGITISGLADKNWTTTTAQDNNQIQAAITQWCANYVRLQVSPADLFSESPYNDAYLQEVEAEVQTIQQYGGNVIISAQSEHYADQPSANPTQETVNFWQTIAPIYENNPRVWFDLFNEPHLRSSATWYNWLNGVTMLNQTYVGMQTLANDIRQVAGNTNLILVEPPNNSQSLNEIFKFPVTGTNIAYAVHPYGQHSETRWSYNFGNEAQKVPVIVDEWSEWDGNKGFCSIDAPNYVPQFLSYLQQNQIGLGVWGFTPGVLITESNGFTPTQLGPDYTCSIPAQLQKIITYDKLNNAVVPDPDAEGAGQLVQAYFWLYDPTNG